MSSEPRAKRTHALLLASVLAGACAKKEPSCPAPTAPLAAATAPPTSLFDAAFGSDLMLGVERPVSLGESFASEGDRVGGFVALPTARCLLALARSSGGILDADLTVFDETGTILSSDEASRKDATVLLCPPLPERVYVSSKVASGAGTLGVFAAEVPLGLAEAVSRRTEARVLGETSGRLEGWPGLEAHIAERRRRLGGRWEDVRRFSMAVEPRAPARTTFAIEPRRCVDALVVPSEEIRSMDVVVESTMGAPLLRATNDGFAKGVVLCSERGDEVTLMVRPRGMSGQVAVVVGRSREGESSAPTTGPLIDRVSSSQSVQALRASQGTSLDGGWGKPKELGVFEARLDRRTHVDLTLPEGCSRLDASSATPLGPLTGLLVDDGGLIWSESQGALGTTLFACVAQPTHFSADFEALGESGPFLLERRTVSAPKAWSDADGPAVARLLSELVGKAPRPDSTRPLEALGVPVPLALAPEVWARHAWVLPEDRCLSVVVAAAGDARGALELGLRDDATGTVTLARGGAVARGEVCSGRRASRIVAEVRARGGAERALLVGEIRGDVAP